MAVKYWPQALGLGGSIEQHIGQIRRVKALRAELNLTLIKRVNSSDVKPFKIITYISVVLTAYYCVFSVEKPIPFIHFIKQFGLFKSTTRQWFTTSLF